MPKYDFIFNRHADIILNVDDADNSRYIDLGHNCATKFPFVLWLHYFQTQGNSFLDRVHIPEDIEFKLDSELEELVVGLRELSERLPLEIADFNRGLVELDIKYFCSGIAEDSCIWLLNPDWNLSLQRTEEITDTQIILELKPEESQDLALNYLNFLRGDHHLATINRDVTEMIRRLKCGG